MKSLQEFINENIVNEEAAQSKSFTFNLAGIDAGEETLKSFENITGVTIDGEKVTVEVTPENFDKLDTFQDIMQQFIDGARKSTRRASDEQYAQKTKSLEDKMNEFNDYLDELGGEDKKEEE